MRKQLQILATLFFSIFFNTLHSQYLNWEVCGSMSLSTSGSPSYFNNSKTFTGVKLSNTDVHVAIGLLGCNPVSTNAGGIQLNGTTFKETNVPVQNCGINALPTNHYTISKDVFNQAVTAGGGTIVFSNFIRDTCVPGMGCNFVSDPCIVMNVSYGVLSTNDVEKPSILVYPNPVKDVLNLSYDKKITTVSIYNLAGQEVISKVVNTNACKIDTSNLTSGTYMLKVNLDTEEKTLKIIKE